MKEFVEKLISRLEEIYNRNNKLKKEAYEEQEWERFDFFTHRNEGIYIAMAIINKLAEEYSADTSQKSANGWIPCSERLPETIDDMLQCVIVTNENDWQGMAYYHPQKGWTFAECHNSDKKIDWTEIIAWQPLPQPYKPQKNEWKDAVMKHFTNVE